MRERIAIIVLVALFFTGITGFAAQTPPIVASDPTACVVTYGDAEYAVSAEDGPVVAFVEEERSTVAGVEVSGIIVIREGDRCRVAGDWIDPAPSRYAAAEPGDALVLAPPATLGGGR